MRPRVLIATWILFAGTCAPQTNHRTSSLEKRLAIGTQTTTSINHITTLLRQAGVWGEVETYHSDCAPPSEYRIPPFDGTLEEGLTQLRSQDNSLQWKAQDDGIVVSRNFPANSLLDAKLPQVTFLQGEPPEKSTDRLLNLSAVKNRMAELKLTLRPPELGFARLPVDAGSEKPVVLGGLTLRQALNAIARADHPRVWLFQQIACNGRTTVRVQWLVK